MSITRDFTIYLNAGISVPPVVHVNQYDQGEIWRFTLLEADGSQYTPSTGALIGVKADGHVIAGVTGTVLGDGRVQITETQQMTAAAGDAIFELTIDGQTHGTANFIVRVEKKPTDGAILSESDLSIIQQGINSVTPAAINESVSNYLAEHMTNPPIDPSLSISNAAADAKVTGDRLTELKTNLKITATNGEAPISKEVTWINGYISSTGKITSSTASKTGLVKLNAGEVVKVGTRNANITIIGSTTSESIAVGDTVTPIRKTSTTDQYEEYSFTTAEEMNIVVCVRWSEYNLSFHEVTNLTDVLKNSERQTALLDSGKVNYEIVGNGSTSSMGVTTGEATRIRTQLIAVRKGDIIEVNTGTLYHLIGTWVGTVDPSAYTESGWTNTDEVINIANDGYVVIVFRKGNNGSLTKADFDGSVILNTPFSKYLNDSISTLEKATDNIVVPFLRNGSIGNGQNANAVTNDIIIPLNNDADYLTFEFIGDKSNIEEYAVAYCLFEGATDGAKTTVAYTDTDVSHYAVNDSADDRVNKPFITVDLRAYGNYDHISFSVWRFANGSPVPIRIASEQYSMKISFHYGTIAEAENGEALHELKNARHVLSTSNKPLTILHFSDLHADSTALNRIVADADEYGANVDEIICTGDMVANTAEQISSWWNPKVLTCIGNHDTASYSGGVYNWTALSVADRISYYISPFESNWGITRESGKSYYYKDYSEQKVRMIVMDGMLYTDNGADATAQTAWLANLLSGAITNGLHVLIAIHAPHGGAVPIDCTFTEYGTGTMPTYSDCNTPQSVIDAVASAITNGLHFIGYIVGHTHHDVMWNVEGDDKQIMYCVTCANVNTSAQWMNADLFRDAENDAFNIVTIDTSRTLVKIVRGGGADISDKMTPRKAICFNYSTGQIIGEVL